jgi:D-alanine-D-alanine ligase
VSCVSAGSVLQNLDPAKYEVVPVGITADGAWVLGSSDIDALTIHDRVLPTVDKTGASLALSTDPGHAGALLALGAGLARV